jgi:hypothetical protein
MELLSAWLAVFHRPILNLTFDTHHVPDWRVFRRWFKIYPFRDAVLFGVRLKSKLSRAQVVRLIEKKYKLASFGFGIDLDFRTERGGQT